MDNDNTTERLFTLLYNSVMYMEEQGETDEVIEEYIGISSEELEAVRSESLDDFKNCS